MEPIRGGAPETLSDKDLVLAFKAGDRAAYDEMYARYRQRVFGVCSRILHNTTDAEEASQETFLRAYQALHRFNGRYQLGAWLARIATNASVDQLRSKARAPVVGLPAHEEASSQDASPEQLVVGDYPRLTEAIAEVKPLHARVLAMRNVEGMSHQEIADRLSMTPSQVKALLHRARSSLRKAWDRAEAWALAPVFAWRSLVDDRSSAQTGSPLLGAGPMFTPLLAEKFAATALVVAVALSGLPSLPQSTSTPVQPAARPALRARDVRPERISVAARRAPAEETAAREQTAPATADISRLIEDTLKGRDKLSSEGPKDDGSEGNPLPRGTTATAKEIVEKVRDLLPQGGPALPDIE